MSKYIHKVNPKNGVAILDVQKIDEKLKAGAEFLAKYDPKDILVVCRRENGWKAAKAFAEAIGAKFYVGRYPAGVITNSQLKTFIEPKLMFVADPRGDRNAIKDSYAVQPKDVRLLSYKMLIDKFNDKYDGLNQRQKNVLREYINNVTNTVALKEFVQAEIPVIQKELKRAALRVGSKVIKIKLNEVNNMLTKINNASVVKDKDVLTMLRYYELIKELKNVESK